MSPKQTMFLPDREVAAVDRLSDAMGNLYVRTLGVGRFDLAAPWGMRIPRNLGWFHVVIRGGCLLTGEGGETRQSLDQGDLLFVPIGRQFVLRDRLDSPLTITQDPVTQSCADHRVTPDFGNTAKPTTLICGWFRFDEDAFHSVLPPFIVVRGERSPHAARIDGILRLIACESASREPGAATILSRLVEILFVFAIQEYVAHSKDIEGSSLKALLDLEIGPVLRLMHRQPEEPWTVASLAERVSMSRSAFAARFSSLVGQPPLHYLHECRMRKASHLLQKTSVGIKQVASRVGYHSVPAFSTAFKRWSGIAPGKYRHAGPKGRAITE
ncbi:MAG: AraC family transcriptional regulator [Phycisphaerales bacterium]|nr:AraC family transcriptional regulator [Phycisphaerales bacterium]